MCQETARVYTSTEKGLKGTVVNRACFSINERSYEIMLPVPLRFFFQEIGLLREGGFGKRGKEKLAIHPSFCKY